MRGIGVLLSLVCLGYHSGTVVDAIAACNPNEVTFTFSESSDVSSLNVLTNCSDGLVSVVWQGPVTISSDAEGIAVGPGTQVNITGANDDATGKAAAAIAQDGAGVRLFTVTGGRLTLTDLEITGFSSSSCGGAVLAQDGSTLYLRGSTTFAGCSSDTDGGAICSTSSKVLLEDSTALYNNTAAARGGSLYAGDGSDIVVRGSAKVSHNTAFVLGGAVYLEEASTLSASEEAVFEFNTVRSYYATKTTTSSASPTLTLGEGGVFGVFDSVLDIEGSVVLNNNIAWGWGGVVKCRGATASTTIGGSVLMYDNHADQEGGVVSVDLQATLTVKDRAIAENNTAGDNGGAFQSWSQAVVTIQDNVILNGNQAGQDAGAVRALDTVTLKITGNVAITNNVASAFGGAVVGAFRSLVEISGNVVLSGNRANIGGGIHFSDEMGINITGNVQVFDNVAQTSGGGIFLSGETQYCLMDSLSLHNNYVLAGDGGCMALESTSCAFRDSTFSECRALSGGAMTITSTEVNGTGLYFTDNKASSNGGGVLLFSGAMYLSNCTLTGNEASSAGGGVHVLADFSTFDCYAAVSSEAGQEAAATTSCEFSSNWANCCAVSSDAATTGYDCLDVNFWDTGVDCCLADEYIDDTATTGQSAVTSQELTVVGVGVTSGGDRAGAAVCAICDSVMTDCSVPGTTLQTLPLAPGFWRPNFDSLNIRDCFKKSACHGGVAIDSTDDYCKEGYMGTLCSECIHGYTKSFGGECKKCGDNRKIGVSIAMSLVCLFAVGACCFFVYDVYLPPVTYRVPLKELHSEHSRLRGRVRGLRDSISRHRDGTNHTGLAPSPGPGGGEADIALGPGLGFGVEAGLELDGEDGRDGDKPRSGVFLSVTQSVTQSVGYGARKLGLTKSASMRSTQSAPTSEEEGEEGTTYVHWWQKTFGVSERYVKRIGWAKFRIPVVIFQIITGYVAITGTTFPPVLGHFFEVLNIISFDLSWLLRAGCVVTLTFYQKLLLVTLLPLALVGLCGLLCLVVTKHVTREMAKKKEALTVSYAAFRRESNATRQMRYQGRRASSTSPTPSYLEESGANLSVFSETPPERNLSPNRSRSLDPNPKSSSDVSLRDLGLRGDHATTAETVKPARVMSGRLSNSNGNSITDPTEREEEEEDEEEDFCATFSPLSRLAAAPERAGGCAPITHDVSSSLDRSPNAESKGEGERAMDEGGAAEEKNEGGVLAVVLTEEDVDRTVTPVGEASEAQGGHPVYPRGNPVAIPHPTRRYHAPVPTSAYGSGDGDSQMARYAANGGRVGWQTGSPEQSEYLGENITYFQMTRQEARLAREEAAWRQKVKLNITTAVVVVLFLLYSTISSVVFATFACDASFKDELGASFLRADYNISCDTDTHMRYALYAGLMIFVYPVGIPVALFFMMIHWSKVPTSNEPHDSEAQTRSSDPNPKGSGASSVATRATAVVGEDAHTMQINSSAVIGLKADDDGGNGTYNGEEMKKEVDGADLWSAVASSPAASTSAPSGTLPLPPSSQLKAPAKSGMKKGKEKLDAEPQVQEGVSDGSGEQTEDQQGATAAVLRRVRVKDKVRTPSPFERKEVSGAKSSSGELVRQESDVDNDDDDDDDDDSGSDDGANGVSSSRYASANSGLSPAYGSEGKRTWRSTMSLKRVFSKKWSSRKLVLPKNKAKALLSSDYRDEYKYWESVEFSRRVLLTGLLVFVAPGTASQATVACVLALGFLIVGLSVNPFRSKRDEKVYLAGCVILLMTMFLSLLTKVDISEDDPQSQHLFAVILVSLNVLLLAVVVWETWNMSFKDAVN